MIKTGLSTSIIFRIAKFLAFFSVTLSSTNLAYSQQELDPRYFYYINGKMIGGWGFQVSDEDDWGGVNANNFRATSKGGKVTLSPAGYVGADDAVRAEWNRKKKRGQLSIYGPHTDLSATKDVAALAFDIKVVRPPNKGVDIAMDCGWPCRAQLNIAKNLRKAPKDQWFTMPIPLNCFTNDNFDLSKINGPFLLSTEGQLEIVLANVRVQRLPEGDRGCMSEE